MRTVWVPWGWGKGPRWKSEKATERGTSHEPANAAPQLVREGLVDSPPRVSMSLMECIAGKASGTKGAATAAGLGEAEALLEAAHQTTGLRLARNRKLIERPSGAGYVHVASVPSAYGRLGNHHRRAGKLSQNKTIQIDHEYIGG
jgi:hypothetical protein